MSTTAKKPEVKVELIEGANHKVTIAGKELSPKPSQKLYNHSPDGFNWGYGGSGPAQLALGLLLHYSDAKYAEAYYQRFKYDVIAKLPRIFIIKASDVTDWIKAHQDKEEL